MDSEELERIMNFIIRQQEKFAESLVQSDERMTRLESGFVAVFKMISDTARAQDRLERSQRRWHQEMKKSHQQLVVSHQELARSQKDFIARVDRHLHPDNGGL